MTAPQAENEFNRRDFLKGGSAAALMTLLGGVPLMAEPAAEPATAKAPPKKVKCAVIGLGAWGREILSTLGRLPQAEIAAICDTYPAFLRRSAPAAPGALQTGDYKTLLSNTDIQAIIVATPTYQHRDIVLAALQSGKHVYCEAPLAQTVEDARQIGLAAKASVKKVFQSGLQMRSDPQRHFLLPFIRSGAVGNPAMIRAQWHKKQSWRAASPNPEREKSMNWRLNKATSLGLLGEIGIHQLDQAGWFLNARPVSVAGFGSITRWNDGRDVADTVQAVLEFPRGVRMLYDCTLANSFDAELEMYYGSDAAVMLRESKAWLFKEVDSPLLGWEVYARKDAFYKATGIALVANATKLVAQGAKPADEPEAKPPLYFAMEAFLKNANELDAAVEDFVSVFGADDPAALAEHVSKLNRGPAAGYLEGFQATVTAIKANEAVLSGERIVLKSEWYELT
ncbi:MAG TPA: Gfo/Idh/MocA family oxidoreductase [Verrucomicrobiae bacterium]|nr:Gfo/Idh/MocA family oxidoreductase [Verrucomicrobiae bacterium]